MVDRVRGKDISGGLNYCIRMRKSMKGVGKILLLFLRSYVLSLYVIT
jgi:hypothetical protein